MPTVANTAFIHPLTVSLYDLDVRYQVPCSTLFRYFEETAMRGSSHFGFTLDWYRQRKQFWVIRTLRMERVCAPGYGDQLEIRTWISAMARVRSDRNYEIRRVRDGQLIARGIANWVFIDEQQKMPTRIDPEIVAMFDKHEEPVLAPLLKLSLHPEASTGFEHSSSRIAQFYEADSAQHINNAVYVDWVEEAVRDAVRAMGYPLALDGSTPLPWFYRHSLEYVKAALPCDAVEIRARLMRRGRTMGEWEVELVNALSHEQLLRANTTTLWVNSQNQPVIWK